MAEQLTDRPQLTTPPEGNDKVWVRDTSDLTDGPAGTDKYQDIDVFNNGIAGGFKALQDGALVPGGSPSTLLFKTTSNPTLDDYSAIQQADILIYADAARLVIGFVLQTFTSYPADIDDSSKFAKFIDNGAAL